MGHILNVEVTMVSSLDASWAERSGVEFGGTTPLTPVDVGTVQIM